MKNGIRVCVAEGTLGVWIRGQFHSAEAFEASDNAELGITYAQAAQIRVDLDALIDAE